MNPSGTPGALKALGWSPLLSAVLFIALLVVGVSPVSGAVSSQTVSATANSSTQSPTLPHGVSLQLVMNTTWDSATPAPLHKMGVFHLDNDFSIDTTGLAVCDSTSLEGKTTAGALAACPGAVVGSGSLTLTTGGLTGAVTVFNGPPSGTDPTILAHVDISNGTVILVVPGQIQTSSRGGDFGKQISMGPFPNIAGIGISHLAVTFNNIEPSPGHHYISATCSDGDHTWNYVVDFTYFDNSTLSVPATQSCTADSTPPVPPVPSATSPASPANENNPRIIGTAEAGSTVKLYKASDCTGAVAGQGSAGAFASPGIRVTVSDNTTTTYYATATDAVGNTSGCSTASVSYTEDSTLVGVPQITASVPASPANQNNPSIKGTAEAGTTVKLYTEANCNGPVAGQGTAAQFAGNGIAISVADDSTTTLFATATNATNNTSACSSLGLTYVEDSTAPAAPSLSSSSPPSPSQDNDPEITGAAEASSTVKLYADPGCTGAIAGQGPEAQFASEGITVHVADGTSTTLFATATDAAGNASACSSSSLRYVENTAATLSGVVSSAQTGLPIPGATVTLFRSDSAAGSFTQVPGGDPVLSADNRANPDTTDASGNYGWGVISGFYRVHASAPGCALGDSQVVELPPAATGLDLALDCPVAPGGSAVGGSQPPPAKPKCKKAKKHKKRGASSAKAHCKKKKKKKVRR
jgi:hypothetical protein